MKNKSFKYSLLLVLTAAIWGAAFVAQSAGLDYVGPYSFNCVRFFLGVMVLLPFILIKDKVSKNPSGSWKDKNLWLGGVICGVLLFAASLSQQLGIAVTTVGKSGFITAFYIVMVPVIAIFFKKKPGKLIWFSVALALVGLFFLCLAGKESFVLVKGDILLFACAILFSFQIIAIDIFAPNVDCLKLSVVEFFICGLCGVPFMLMEGVSCSGLLAAWLPLGYAGFFSCGIAYTLQAVSQKEVKPAVASVIMSLESVFSVIFGFIILHQHLTLYEGIGCVIMFIAVILAQIEPQGKKK